MFRKCLAAAVLVLSLSWTVAAQDTKTVIDNASKAMGADNLKTIQYSGPGSEFSFGQAFIPGQPWPVFKNKTYTRTVDFEAPAYRIDRVPEPPDLQRRGGGLAPAQTQTVIVNANTPWPQQLQIWMTPFGFLKTAASSDATVKSQTMSGKKYEVITFTATNNAKVNGIRYVINTHGHFDHSSGLRTFVAEGATIITHQQNKSYYEKIFAQPHTLNPDKQEQAKKKLSIETVTDKKVLTDGNHVIELHRMQNSLHNDGLLVAYLPKEKILVEADAFNPPADVNAPATPNPNNFNLVENLNRLKLDVETIIPVHYPADSRKVTVADLMRIVGRSN